MSPFRSVTSELREACKLLQPGQMVHTPEMTLMDAMAAIQILDPRMDGGISPIPAQLIAPCDRIPAGSTVVPFDVHAVVSLDDVIWIIDRLLACEAAWLESASLSGASLSQTIHTCLYVHELSALSKSGSGQDDDDAASSSLARQVLRPFVTAVLKGAGLIWDELTKGNLMDGEDFNGDKAGIGLLEDLDPQFAINMLDESLDWLQRLSDVDESAKSAIRERLQLRKYFLTSVALISRMDPTLSFGRLANISQSLREMFEYTEASCNIVRRFTADEGRSISKPGLSSAPSPVARAAFDPWIGRRASSQAAHTPMSLAPPQLLTLGQPNETLSTYTHLFKGMMDFTRLAAGPEQGWRAWKCFFDDKAVHFQQQPGLPYVRSLWQSAVCSDATVALQMPLSYIADSFLFDVAGVQPGALLQALHSTSQSAFAPMLQQHHHQRNIQSAPLGHRFSRFMERLAGLLVAHIRNLAQNRSRSKRRMAHAYGDLLSLSDEATSLGTELSNALGGPQVLHPDLLYAAVQTLTLDGMLHSILAGFELELYRTEEYAGAYWMAQKMAEELTGVFDGLLEWVTSQPDASRRRSTVAYLQQQLAWTSALGRISQALSLIYDGTCPSAQSTTATQWAWLAQASPPDAEASASKAGVIGSVTAQEGARNTFRKRFKWLVLTRRPESARQLDELWTVFQRDAERAKEIGSLGRLADAAALLKRAAADCDRISSTFDASADVSLHHQLALALTAIATKAQQTVKHRSLSSNSDDGDAAGSQSCLLPLRFDAVRQAHPWFPTLVVDNDG